MESGYVITNKFERPTETISIIANKVWNDNTEQASRRPESVTLVVKNAQTGEKVESKVVNSSNLVAGTTNTWSVEFTGLQKYDENGNEIKYTLEERETKEGDLHFYRTEANNVAVEDNQATIRNNFVTPGDTTQVTVTKVWNDNEDANGRRPNSIKLQVKNGEEVVSEKEVTANDNWTYTFGNLPKYDSNGKEIVYTATEAEVNNGDLKFYTNDGVTGDMSNGYKVTNTFTVPNEKVELTVNKVWEDNDIQAQRRPGVVIINVKGEDGTVVDSYELNTASETSHTFTNLPKYNSKGQEINYTVEEAEKNPGDLHFYTSEVGTMIDVEENKKQVTITNTFSVPDDKADVTVTKVWSDNSNEAGKRPASIKLLLKDGTETVREEEVRGEKDTWQHTFTDLPKYDENGQEKVYTVDEAEVNGGDLQFYNKAISGLTVTNTFTQNTDKVDVPVTKVWKDNDVQAQRRPSSVMIILKANGEEINRVEVSGEGQTDKDNWTYTFTNLPKYDEYNNIINYTVDEAEKTSGDLKFYSKSIDGYTITNTFTKPDDTVSLTVNKAWEDQENVYNKRPNSVRVIVKDSKGIVTSGLLEENKGWTYTFKGLEKYDENGQEISYTVEEEEVSEGSLFYYEGTSGKVTSVSDDSLTATITNKMTKIPGEVIVKYVDKIEGKEISDETIKEGVVGDTFDVTEDKKDIEGYTLIEEPPVKTGEYTTETQEVTYYYAKNTTLTIKYLEKDDTPEDNTDNVKLAEEVVIPGYEGLEYNTESNKKDIKDYTLVGDSGNTEGTMSRDGTEVIYYYSKDTNVIVRYLEKDNTPGDNTDNKVLSEPVVINGYEGLEYNTESNKQDIDGYTLVGDSGNLSGTMTKEPIEVIYYYSKNTSVIVKYLEKDDTPEDNTDNKVLAKEEVINGYVGKDYKTDKKDINNYTFIEDTKNTSGQMTEDKIEVIYYYLQNTSVKVEHIDRETNELLDEETITGKVGDVAHTGPEDFEGYVLVESPKEPDVVMDKTGEQVVKYYYAHVSGGVIEKHIDIITGHELGDKVYEGNEGDPYTTSSKDFEGYDLVRDKLPANSSGTMKRDEVIEVKYYYKKKAKVVVKYVDEATGEEITKKEEITGHENDNYETKTKDVSGYSLVGDSGNTKGKMVVTVNEDGTFNIETYVTYYYKKVSGGIIVNHIDIDTGKTIESERKDGNVGDRYETSPKDIEEYDLVTEKLPENASGEMTEETIVVNYYYEKKAIVKVQYIDKLTGEKLDEEEITGHVGDKYKAEEKEFDGYDLVEKPSNGEGEMAENQIVVKYYYVRKAEVEVKYLEKGTDYEIAESELINGHVGDKYETGVKDIQYYKFVERTDNWNGTMSEGKIIVKNYYEKKVFNLGVDKWVESVNVNGISTPAQSIESSNKIYKIDINRKKADSATIKITYKIRVTNNGEIEGSVGKITDIIPTGTSYYQEDNEIYWNNNNGILSTEDLAEEVIKPGEYKEIEMTLRVKEGSVKFGQKDNLVILSELNNPAGFQDTTKEDNSDTSNMIITVATGLDRNDRIVIIGIVQIVLAITIGLLLSYKKKEKTIATKHKAKH